jgi:HPt (histidine-containing phosphotransfer) domain-containing protein
MEGNRNETLIHDDTTLLFISDVLSYIINSRIEWEKELAKSVAAPASKKILFDPDKPREQELLTVIDGDEVLEKAKAIPNLNVDKGILLLGGEKKKYTELLRITVKVISEELLKMRRLHTEDLAAFAIEVHGIKAALFNIGAEALGDEARQLEFAAKSEDAVYCRENYPALEEKLRIFSRNLAALFPREERSSRKGNVKELEKTLVRAGEACDNFDVSTASGLLSPYVLEDWEDGIIRKSLQNILGDMENLEYESVKGKIMGLLAALRDNAL